MKKSTLRLAHPENVIRLAKYLKLRVEGMSIKQVIALLVWRFHRNRQWGGID